MKDILPDVVPEIFSLASPRFNLLSERLAAEAESFCSRFPRTQFLIRIAGTP